MDKKNHISTGKIYAFDFDGTLCQEAYPAIGKPNKSMIRFVKKVQNRGHRTILWTCRCGKPLDEAVNWCKEQGIIFDAVNANLPETLQKYGTDPRKITADYYIDDKTLGAHPLLLSIAGAR
jgi:hypothetical protein